MQHIQDDMTVNTSLTIQDIEAFLMILVRISSFMSVAPVYNSSSVPQRVKIGLSAAVALLVYTAVPIEIPAYSSVAEYAFLIIKESATGILIAFSAYICYTAIFFAGRMIDTEIGMSMANMFDATTKTQVSVSGNLYNYLFLIMMVITDMHHFLLQALVDSFQVIPVGGIRMTGLYGTVLEFFADYFSIGFRLMMPVFAVTLIVSVILGLLAKVSPQMNMFAVGIQIKVLVGLGVMFLLAGSIPSMSDFLFDKMRMMVSQTIKGMM